VLSDAQASDVQASDEPPVVARCVVEVRSDGSLSIARGIFELEGERVMLEGKGRTPQELVSAIAKGALSQARERISDGLRDLEHKLLSKSTR